MTLPPTIFSEKHLQEQLDDVLNDMFREWERDQANMSFAARKFFGTGFSAEVGKFAQKLVEAAIKPETGQDIIKGAVIGEIAGLHTGNLTMPVLSGAGAGFVVALIFRGFESWRNASDAAKKSPLRYLTTLQDQGVSFSVSR